MLIIWVRYYSQGKNRTRKYLICIEKDTIVSTSRYASDKISTWCFDSSGKRRFIGTDKRRQLERIGGKTISLSIASVITKAITEITDSFADPASRNS